MHKDREAIYSATKIALCVSVLSLVSYIVIPLPATASVLSLQTAAVGITALILSPLQSAWAMVLYIGMGAVGLPVFAGGTAGIGKLFGVTGGYYFGFLVSGVAVSALKGREIDFKRYTAVCVGVAVPIQHLCAVAMMSLHNGGDIGAAFVSISLPFIAGDIAKGVAAAFFGAAINRAIKKARL